jgi:hypothetical protein
MTQSSIATAADYADALITARRAKNVLFWVLLIILLARLGIFFAVRYSDNVFPAAAAAAAAQPNWLPLAEYFVRCSGALAMGTIAVLGVVLLLILLIMLVGRLIGVSRVTGAFIVCVILTLILFPWQAFLRYPGVESADFRIPGVLYSWFDLTLDAKFDMHEPADLAVKILKWTRYVVAPIVAIILLLILQTKSRRGLRQALGETNVEVDAGAAT